MTAKIRIGFAGVGAMGQMAHLKNYVLSESCEVTALAELRRETGRAVAERYRIPNCYTSAGEMLAATNQTGGDVENIASVNHPPRAARLEAAERP